MLLALAIKGLFMSLMLCMDIGVVNTAAINTGIRGGFRPAFSLTLGSCFGDLLYAVLSMVGMAVILQIDAVRWVMWLGGGAVLLWLAFSMARQALRATPTLAPGDQLAPPLSLPREFARGFAMALASPSSLIWFAAVGGAIIAQSTSGGLEAKAAFLAGFFAGAVGWSVFISAVAAAGRRWAGQQLKVWCCAISALLFAYFAVDVLVKGWFANVANL